MKLLREESLRGGECAPHGQHSVYVSSRKVSNLEVLQSFQAAPVTLRRLLVFNLRAALYVKIRALRPNRTKPVCLGTRHLPAHKRSLRVSHVPCAQLAACPQAANQRRSAEAHPSRAPAKRRSPIWNNNFPF